MSVHIYTSQGFDLTEERANDMLATELGFAHFSEFSTKILQAPSVEDIRKEQGYHDTL